MKSIIPFFAALLISEVAFAQTTITSFTPTSGITGFTVTISGTNFSTTPANNIVKFNGTAATVVASTTTSIQTSVPANATTGFITVQVGASTGTSSSVFCVGHTPASTAGLLAYFSFNGNTNDLSGNSNNATNVGANLTTDRCGNPNSAILLNGTPTSYLKIPTSSSMESIITTQELTISTWINITNLASTVFPIFERYNPNNDNGMLFEVNTSVGGELFNADYSTGINVVCNRTWNLNQWYYVSVTYSKALGLAKFYVNGDLACSIPYSQSITTDIPRDFIIGQSISGPDEYTNGALDEFRLYNRALSDCEIRSLYSLTAIFTFTPVEGQFGTTVTISGTNFDPTPSNNIVSFNGTPATVTASSATTITTTVPLGATTGPITVTAADCTPVTYAGNFIVTYAAPFGNTVLLNGTDDYVIVADNPALRPNDLTLESWINFTTAPSGQVIIGKALNATGNNNSYALYYLSGSLRGFVNNNATQNPEITFPWTPVTGQWYHVAFTFNNSTKLQSLYLNGALVASGTAVAGPEYNNTPITIGADFDFGSFDGFVSGRIDEARIWNVARTQTQIQSNLNSTLIGNETGLVAYYKMDEVGAGAGITTVNSATATGTVLNGTTVGTSCTPIFTDLTPTITSFSPASGVAGTSITITGAKFSTTAANNIVKFNGTAAVVTASTATSITTTVPSGATTGPITVGNACTTSSTSGAVFGVGSFSINITTQPQANTTVCGGATVTLAVAASGTTNIAYHWQLLNTTTGLYADLTNDGTHSGIATTTLTIYTGGSSKVESYRNRVSGDFVSDVNSNAAIVTVNAIAATPTTTQVIGCLASSATLKAFGGVDGQYRWYTSDTGGTAIAGEGNRCSHHSLPPPHG